MKQKQIEPGHYCCLSNQAIDALNLQNSSIELSHMEQAVLDLPALGCHPRTSLTILMHLHPASFLWIEVQLQLSSCVTDDVAEKG